MADASSRYWTGEDVVAQMRCGGTKSPGLKARAQPRDLEIDIKVLYL